MSYNDFFNLTTENYSANIIRSKTTYSKNINDIKSLKVRSDKWSFDIILVVKLKIDKTPYLSLNNMKIYQKFHLDGIHRDDGWFLTVSKLSHPNNHDISFNITKDGQIQYSSEYDFEIKYNITYI
jgi:hypothetical protein